MNYNIQNINNGVSISLIGKLVVSEIDSVRNEILGAINEAKNINLDLKDVDDCDTAGIQLIASIIKLADVNIQICSVSDAISNSCLRIGHEIKPNSTHMEENSYA